MTKEEAYKTLKENLCAMCAYGSQNMESCNIRSCDNRDAIKILEQEKSETVTEFADRCRECGKMRKGHWIWNYDKGYCKCSECSIGMGHTEFDYCPNCGCRMVDPQESEEV